MKEYDDLIQKVTSCSADVAKAENGNESAGVRVRNTMQEIKDMAQNVRVKILEMRGKK